MPLDHQTSDSFPGQANKSPFSPHQHSNPPSAISLLARQVSAIPGDTSGEAQRLLRDWTPEIGRYGLTSTTVLCDHSIPRQQSAVEQQSHHCQLPTPQPIPDPSKRSPPLQGKRPSEEEEKQANGVDEGSPAAKKARLVAPGRIDIGSLRSTPDSLIPRAHLATSPLFYSMSAKHPLGRPPSWSASEAVASMMGGDAPKGVTTVRLPKGQIAGSPARSASTPGSWASFEFAGSSRSPDSRPLPPALQLLQHASVIELLEQDERPTFVIDLQNRNNFDPGPLSIVFANAALRASGGVIGLVIGDTSDPEHTADFARFKAWILSFVNTRNNESMDVCLPSLSYGGISWTCSTLRRRFRFVSGNASAVSITPTSPSPITQASSVLDQRARGPIPTKPSEGRRDRPASEIDYFVGIDHASSPTGSHARSHSEPRTKLDGAVDGVVGRGDEDDLMSTPVEEVQTFDWTRIPIDTPNIPPHVAFARSVDWASTPLGPLEDWPSELRSMSNMIMGSPHPAAMYWGPEYVAIYNEAYIGLAGQKHPQLMGMRYQDAWREIWSDISPYFEAAWNSGQSTMKHDDRLFLHRHGYVEETYFNWAIIPLVGGDGSVVAIYNPAFENTRRKINERRMLALNDVGEKISLAKDVKGFWTRVRQGLEYSDHDVPFALIYSVTDDSESEVASMHSGSFANPPQIMLEGSLGAPSGHPAAVTNMDLRSSDEGFAPYMREVLAHPSTPLVLRTDDGSLPAELIEGLSWRGFGDPCRTIVVFPVHPTTGDSVVGFIVLGVNPRRPYDEDYELFVSLMARQLATSLASVVLFEEEIKRGQKAARLAALDRQELSQQLRERTLEAIQSEYRFTRMAEFAPVGMFIADGQGIINYCNDMWWQISRHHRSTKMEVWMQSIRDEDRPEVERVWNKLVREKVSISHEFRFKTSRLAHGGHDIDTWVLMSAYPEKDEHGDLKSIFGCMTDISQQKWAENFQKLRREEALELKRQQENFIDITSHEMRNPLSAVLQCADEINESIGRYRVANHSGHLPKGLELLLDNCVEASNTISLCANHQKRIVDDILTLSKLDSKLLLVTPVDVQPLVVVEKVLKMFEPELRSNDIRGEFRIEQSYLDLGLDWCKLDPSRLRQVLINLMTNAIKFTVGREKRSITISLGASTDVSKSDTMYFPRHRNNDLSDPTDEADWGEGEKLSLMLAVSDTGPGLTEEEQKLLFQRFQQASPRTHVQYGGSGLGLFICRTLTELQGGQIGVRSNPGFGSTFNFYIRSRRSMNPQPQLGADTPTPKASPVKPDPRLSATKLQYSTQPALPPPEALVPTEPSSPDPDTEMRDDARPVPLDVLIVEDNVVNQRVLSRLLKVSGNNTHVANHGAEALELLQTSRFWRDVDAENPDERINISVILMDLEMPVMDGMTCARKIRELEAEGTISRHIPIIAVTAYARPQQIANAKAAGVDDVVSKPFRIPELIPKINELVEKYNTYPGRSALASS